MSTLIIPKKEAEQIVNEDHDDWEMIKETIKNQSRWSTHFSGVFKNITTGKYYEVGYSRGSTEQQDDDLFYTQEVEFFEVGGKRSNNKNVGQSITKCRVNIMFTPNINII